MLIFGIIKKIIIRFRLVLIGITVIALGYYFHQRHFAQPAKSLYKTVKPTVHDVRQVVSATGLLVIKDSFKVGSIEAGTIKDILVKENQRVDAGTLLAIIDNGRGETEVKQSEAEVARARAALNYQAPHFERNKKLFQLGQVSRDFYEQEQQLYEVAQANLAAQEALLARRKLDYNNTRIQAPAGGIITAVNITKGERISAALEKVLFEIAPDLTKMQAELEIDESDIGQIKPNQKVNITVDTYSAKKFKGVVSEISYSPKKKDTISFYKTVVEVDNSEHLLRPGMTVNAHIKIAKAKKALTIGNQSFYINDEYIKQAAHRLKMGFKPVDAKDKKIQIKQQVVGERKYVWIIKDNSFIEIPITVQLTDDINFAISEGLTLHDDLVIDVEEPNEMDEIYKKWFSGSF